VVRFDAAAPEAHPTVQRAWVTCENLHALLKRAGVEGRIGVFSLDIDGVDYWIWRSLEEVRPAIVIVEFNAALGGLEHCVTVPYNAQFRWDFSGRCGASLGALLRLAEHKGYRLVHCTGPNAFFVAEEHCGGCEIDPPFAILRRQWGLLGTPDPRFSLVDVSDPELPVPWQPRASSSLGGLRVLDLSRRGAGSLAAMMLADFGADVVRVDSPTDRQLAPVAGETDTSMERNKYAVVLDLTHAEGQRLLRKLAARADVLIESYPDGTLEQWNCGADRLLARNCRLVIARLGESGAREPRGGSLRDVPLPASLSAMALAFGVVCALRAREITGRGQVVEPANAGSQAANLTFALARIDVEPWVRPRLSETPARDRFPARSAGHDNESVFCDVLGLQRDRLEALSNAGVL
jgi:hypothetical protein